MRGNILKGAEGRTNSQFYSLFHRDDAWPKLLIFVIIIFYVTIFALFALSYTYIFSGLWGSGTGSVPTRMVSSKFDIAKTAIVLPEDLTESFGAKILENIPTDQTAAPVTATSVQVNGSTVPVPDNGSIHKDVSTGTGNASVNLNVQSSGSSNIDSSSSIDVHVTSSSNTVSEVQQ